MPGGAALTCPRDATPTQLTCTRCATPICPLCLVRTDVGLRCPDCADASTPGAGAGAAAGRRSRAPVIVVVVVVAIVVLLLVVGLGLARRGSGGSGDGTVPAAPQRVSRADLGFAVDLPSAWIVDVDQTPGSIFFAHAVPPRTSARVFRGQTDQPLEQNMANVVDGLRQQGADSFSQQPVQVGDLPGIRLDYTAADGPAGALAAHSSYRVKKGNAVFSLVLATTDAAGDQQVLAGIASSFRLL